MEKHNSIKAIDRKSIHQICSGQVVLTLAIAVKELVENSIDAGATTIEVKLKEYGSKSVEVVDNGCGLKEHDFKSLTLKHHTSKLEDFSDLINVGTFGFRGEALSSLCALSKMTVITCHKDDTVGTHLEYDHDGALMKQHPVARQVGTSIILEDLFSTLPVRHKEFQKNLRKEFGKMIQLLTAYCIISTGKRITCTNCTSKGKSNTVLSTNGESSIKSHLTSLFGTKQVSSLLEFIQISPLNEVLEEYSITASPEEDVYKIEGYLSSKNHGEGRSSADRQFFFINGRPCELSKASKIVNDVYHSFNRYQYPFVCLNVKLTEGFVDVNVTPDKRQIFVSHEKLLLAILKSSVMSMYANEQHTIKTFSPLFNKSHILNFSPKLDEKSNEDSEPVLNLKRTFAFVKDDTTAEQQSKNICLDVSSNIFMNSSMSIKDDKIVNSPDEMEVDKSVSEKDIHESATTSSQCLENSSSQSSQNIFTNMDVEFTSTQPFKENTMVEKVKFKNFDSPQSSLLKQFGRCTTSANTSFKNTRLKGSKISSPSKRKKNTVKSCSDMDDFDIDFILEKHRFDLNAIHNENFDGGSTDEVNKPECNKEDEVSPLIKTQIDDNDELVKAVVVVRDKPTLRRRKETVLTFSMDDLRKKWTNRRSVKGFDMEKHRKFRSKLNAADAEAELEKEISKDMFAKMEIIGQFNLGFIITRLEEDLFIIDQHATDEKYNFEILRKDTVLNTQLLLNPLTLELMAASETTLLDNIPIFEKNGFKFNINEEHQIGQRVQLVSVPVSQNWSFGKEDIDELIFMLTDNSGCMCRPSRVNQMFASRACRKSVMIGSPLSHQLMKKIVNHMGEIEQPWNCPHGRPTMRHLLNLNLLS